MALALVITNDAVVPLIQKTLREHNLIVKREKFIEKAILRVSAPEKLLDKEGELQKIFKRRVDPAHGPWISFKDGPQGEDVALAEYDVSNADDFMLNKFGKLWTPAEESYILFHILERVNIDGGKLDIALGRGPKEDESTDLLPRPQLFLVTMNHEDLLEEIVPLQCSKARHDLPLSFSKDGFPLSQKFIDAYKDYFGGNIAFYFVFMRAFTIWLIVPGIIGFIIWLFNRGEVDNSAVTPIFSAFMCCWSVVFVGYVERENTHWAVRWGYQTVEKRYQLPRAGFRGEPTTCPVLFIPTYTFPKWKRYYWYGFSTAVTLVMLGVSFFFMILSLNLQGYIHSSTSEIAEGVERFDSPFYVEWLASFAAPGAILDPTGDGDWLLYGYITFLPVILHSMVILYLNKIYSYIAKWLTELENHKVVAVHEASLGIKRFLFEGFDCYIALFYVAFFMRDVNRLRSELVGLYTVDSVRRALTETVVPYITIQVKRRYNKMQLEREKKDDDAARQTTTQVSPLEEELNREEYDSFDDWLEMVIQFGYITLFASAFPLASAVSLLCNIVEVYSDAFKLKKVFRKPLSQPAQGIPPMWFTILKCMMALSIITNTMIFGLSSDQMLRFFPNLIDVTPEAANKEEHELKAPAVWILFAGEHLVALLCVATYYVFDKTPAWVKATLMRREYHIEQLFYAEGLRKKYAQRVSSRTEDLLNPIAHTTRDELSSSFARETEDMSGILNNMTNPSLMNLLPPSSEHKLSVRFSESSPSTTMNQDTKSKNALNPDVKKFAKNTAISTEQNEVELNEHGEDFKERDTMYSMGCGSPMSVGAADHAFGSLPQVSESRPFRRHAVDLRDSAY